MARSTPRHPHFDVTIYHRPQCQTSRQVLALIHAAGYVPTVVDYGNSGWTSELLRDLLISMQETPKRLLRVAGTPARELGLLARGVSDDQIIDAMVQHPNLVNRPIVVTALGTVLARPPMRALSVLPKGCVGLPFDAKP